jgi:lysophospholipase L1-like esterase
LNDLASIYDQFHFPLFAMKNSTESKITKPSFALLLRNLLLAAIFLFLLAHVPVTAQNRKIAIFGSSVAKGSGDTTGVGGYAGLIKEMLEKRGWQVVNVSRGGDNTTKIMPRFEAELLPQKPKYVILGLSLGNEGIATSNELAMKRNFEKYRNGMLRLVQLCRENGMYPIVVNCYTRNDFQSKHYAAIKKMNLIINTWDVPSINVLGAIDNGKGNWLEGFYHDNAHPDFKGHKEMFYALVPSLFDAIEAGKTVPYKIRSADYVTIKQPASAKPLSYKADDQIHSFSVCFQVKTDGNGTLAVISGSNTSNIAIKNGKILYNSTSKETISADTTGENKGWQYIVLTHQSASGKTAFFVNGKLSGVLNESIDFKEFVLGGTGEAKVIPSPTEAGYKNLLFYRSALNPDEVQALYYDQLLQSSLEIYAPLNDKEFKPGTTATNYAQSLSKLLIDGDIHSSATQ